MGLVPNVFFAFVCLFSVVFVSGNILLARICPSDKPFIVVVHPLFAVFGRGKGKLSMVPDLTCLLASSSLRLTNAVVFRCCLCRVLSLFTSVVFYAEPRSVVFSLPLQPPAARREVAGHAGRRWGQEEGLEHTGCGRCACENCGVGSWNGCFFG